MRIDTRYVPDGLPENDKKLACLLDELGRLDAQHAGAFKARDIASRELDTAPGSDSALYASALRAGEDDPGPVAVRTAQEKVAAAQRTLDAAEIASGQVTDEISDRVRDIAAKLRKQVADETDKARTALGKGLDAVSAALADHDRAQHVGRWITAVAGRQSSTPTPDADTRLVVTDLLGERRPVAWHGVESALLDLTDPTRIATREAQQSRSLAAGVAQNITPAELVHGRGAVPDEQPVG